MIPATSSVAVRERLRIAIHKSGRLAEPARALLAACGLVWRESSDRLFCFGETWPIDLLLVRDDDIPGLLADGVCDLGIVGRNVLREGPAAPRPGPRAAREWRPLGFGRCRLMLAIAQDDDWSDPSQLAGCRIATSHPTLLAAWLAENGVSAEVVTLSGSVEIALRLGKADAICDLVSSGATLAANLLRPVAVVLDSEAVLAGPAMPFGDARGELASMLLRRLDSVLQVRDSRLLICQAARAALPGLLRLLSDAEAPTITTIEGTTDRLAVQALCRGAVGWQRLEELRLAGAQGLMVLPVERMLA